MFLCAGLGYTYTCVDMEARTQCQVSSSTVLHLCLEAGSLTQRGVDKCAVLRALAGRPCLYFPNARITSMCHHGLLFFPRCWILWRTYPLSSLLAQHKLLFCVTDKESIAYLCLPSPILITIIVTTWGKFHSLWFWGFHYPCRILSLLVGEGKVFRTEQEDTMSNFQRRLSALAP